MEEQSEGFALKNFVHLPPSEEEVVKQTQPHEQGCGLNIRATKNPGMSREGEGEFCRRFARSSLYKVEQRKGVKQNSVLGVK